MGKVGVVEVVAQVKGVGEELGMVVEVGEREEPCKSWPQHA
jgi:hypothetical protein